MKPSLKRLLEQSLIWEFNWFYLTSHQFCCHHFGQLAHFTLNNTTLDVQSYYNHNRLKYADKIFVLLSFFIISNTHTLNAVLLTSTLDLSTFSLMSLMQLCWRFCTVKLFVHPAISKRKLRSISMPRSVRSTSGWNCVPYSFFCSLAIPDK